MTPTDLINLLRPLAKEKDKYNQRVPNFPWKMVEAIKNDPKTVNEGARGVIIDIIKNKYGTTKADEVAVFFKGWRP